jgi:hypothetical protein
MTDGNVDLQKGMKRVVEIFRMLENRTNYFLKFFKGRQAF